MMFTSIIVAALATLAAAKPRFTNSNFDVVTGRTFELKWADAKGPVTIDLLTGKAPDGLKPVQIVATGLTGTSFVFDVPKNVPSGDYAFSVRDGEGKEDINYSLPFSLVGTGSSSTTSGVSSTMSSTSSRSTTSSMTSSSATTMVTSSSTSVNSTATTSSGSSSTRSSSTTSSTSPAPTIPNSNGAGKVQSSLALVMVGAVAYAFFN
ncbi:hypothetical protein GGTG_01467 [Gaeumannomyces tritici R3-111a-1]|uniref:Extracellular matrix protein n=1 Tax=Gaeumannomyces tritici (strain R3-111a-1) TaxID=644352 RepID=J3NJN7_GAET3|nr:hypothetical protein GGTG_01467 [Gaeumannomyces tritici R3-111a-1]EJT81489.1 hypothetical protein GGTG_01467 [Gaeumannomyces tritici R3-111a-1]